MAGASAKSVKEDISRATAYARRFMGVKALKSAASAFEAYATSTAIMGRAKFELEVLLQDMLRELELVPEIKAQLRGPFKFQKGGETKFVMALTALALHLEKLEQKAEDATRQQTEGRIAMAFEKAVEALREQNLPTARRVLNTVCEQFPGEAGIFTSAAKLLAEAGLHSDAIPFAQKAVELNPKDAQAFGIAVESCKQTGEWEKAERFLREALKNFGAHPKTFVSLAKVLYQMGKWDQAYDAARAAYDRDSSLEEAKEVLDLTEKRVMG